MEKGLRIAEMSHIHIGPRTSTNFTKCLFNFRLVIVVVLVAIAVLLAIILFTYRKIEKNDADSRFVKCYHLLCPGRHLQVPADPGNYNNTVKPV